MGTVITPGMWRANVEALGEAKARAWAQRNGIQIPGEETMPVTPTLAVNNTPAPAATPAAPATTGLAVPTDFNTQALDIQRQIMANAQEAEQLRRAQFERAQQALLEQRMGPSLSERLAQISAAFFAPKRMPGFAGAMDKLMPVLGAQTAQRRTADTERATALRELEDRYAEGTIEARGGDLQNKLALLKLVQAQAADLQPKVQFNPVTGELSEVPKNVATPQSQQEYDALAPGTWYRVPGGPKAGMIIMKGA